MINFFILLSLCHHSLIFLLSVVVSPYESTGQCKYLVFMICCCLAYHEQNSLCHISHCIYSSIINRFVPERKAEALAWRLILFSSVTTTGISHEHLDHTVLQGKVANCTFQVGLSGVHSYCSTYVTAMVFIYLWCLRPCISLGELTLIHKCFQCKLKTTDMTFMFKQWHVVW